MKKCIAGLLAVGACAASHSYEIDTHSRITEAAYFASVMFTTSAQTRVGLRKSRPWAPNPGDPTQFPRLHLGQKYYDPLKVGGPDRYATAFDAENRWVMKAYRAPKPQRRWFYSQFDGRDEPYFPVDWMARGVIYGMIAV